MAEQTKMMLAKALRTVLEKKPLDKITISDLTNVCGVNRQTFYYHFHDIYDLIEWIYLTEANRAIGANKTYDTWQSGMLDMCNVMLKNKDFVAKTYHSRSGGHLGEIITNLSYDLLIGVVNEISQGYSISEENKKFIANFYKFGYAGLLLQWVDNNMEEDPGILVQKLEYLMEGNFLEAVKRYSCMERNKRRAI